MKPKARPAPETLAGVFDPVEARFRRFCRAKPGGRACVTGQEYHIYIYICALCKRNESVEDHFTAEPGLIPGTGSL